MRNAAMTVMAVAIMASGILCNRAFAQGPYVEFQTDYIKNYQERILIQLAGPEHSKMKIDKNQCFVNAEGLEECTAMEFSYDKIMLQPNSNYNVVQGSVYDIYRVEITQSPGGGVASSIQTTGLRLYLYNGLHSAKAEVLRINQSGSMESYSMKQHFVF